MYNELSIKSNILDDLIAKATPSACFCLVLMIPIISALLLKIGAPEYPGLALI